MTSEELFAKTPPTRLFFKAAIPGAIGMLAAALYQTFDGIFVGQYLGTGPHRRGIVGRDLAAARPRRARGGQQRLHLLRPARRRSSP